MDLLLWQYMTSQHHTQHHTQHDITWHHNMTSQHHTQHHTQHDIKHHTQHHNMTSQHDITAWHHTTSHDITTWHHNTTHNITHNMTSQHHTQNTLEQWAVVAVVMETLLNTSFCTADKPNRWSREKGAMSLSLFSPSSSFGPEESDLGWWFLSPLSVTAAVSLSLLGNRSESQNWRRVTIFLMSHFRNIVIWLATSGARWAPCDRHNNCMCRDSSDYSGEQ